MMKKKEVINYLCRLVDELYDEYKKYSNKHTRLGHYGVSSNFGYKKERLKQEINRVINDIDGEV